MSVEDNVALVRRWIDAVNEADLRGVEDLLADGFVYHGPPNPDVVGREAMKSVLRAGREIFPGTHYVIDDVIASGDKVAVRFTCSGVHKGEFRGIAGSGKKVVIEGAAFYRLDNGRIAHMWAYEDELGLIGQIE